MFVVDDECRGARAVDKASRASPDSPYDRPTEAPRPRLDWAVLSTSRIRRISVDELSILGF